MSLKRIINVKSIKRSFTTATKPKVETISSIPTQKAVEKELPDIHFDCANLGAWEFSQVEFDPRSLSQVLDDLRQSSTKA